MVAAVRPFNVPSTTARKDGLPSGADRPTRLLPAAVPPPRAGSVLAAHGDRARPLTPAGSRAGHGVVIDRPSAVPLRAEVATVLPSDVRLTDGTVGIVHRIGARGMAVAAAVADLRFATAPHARGGSGARALRARTVVRARASPLRPRQRVPMILATSRAVDSAATVPQQGPALGNVGKPLRIAASVGARMASNVATVARHAKSGRPCLPAHDSNEPRSNGRHASWRGRVPRGRRTGSCVPR